MQCRPRTGLPALVSIRMSKRLQLTDSEQRPFERWRILMAYWRLVLG